MISYLFFDKVINVWASSDGDSVSTKKYVVDFDSNKTAASDIEKQWSKLPLMPSMDLEILGSELELCDFDIFTEKRKWTWVNGKRVCEKGKEFTPLYIDPDKLKAYVVPYVDMTAEIKDDKGILKKHQVKVRMQKCNETHFEKLNFTMTAEMKVKMNERLCPILNSDYDRLYLKND